MTERSQNVAIGLTALAGLVGLAFLLSIFGYLPALFQEGYTVSVKLKSSGGIMTGSRVKLDGIDIGKVVNVKPGIVDTGRGVIASLLIQSEYDIPRGALIHTEAPLLGGTAVISFDTQQMDPRSPQYQAQSAPLAKDGSAQVVGTASTSLTQFAAEMRSAMAGPTQSFEKLASSFEQLSKDWSDVAHNVNQLIGQRAVGDVDAGKTPGNLSTVLARVDQRLREMQVTLQGANAWLNDEKLRADIQAGAANVKTLTAKLQGTTDKADAMIDATRSDIDSLTKRFIAAADDFSNSVNSLHQTIETVRTGKGSVAQLLNNPSLYNNLNDSATRIGDAVRDMRLLIEKWKKEGLPVQF